MIRAYPLATIAGVIPALVVVVGALSLRGALRELELVAAALLIALGSIASVGIAFIRDVLTRVPKNGFGLVSGIDDRDTKNLEPLGRWLTRELELTAGLEPDAVPLTFGMLWAGDTNACTETLDTPNTTRLHADRRIDLRVVTTSLSMARPYLFPNDIRVWYFREEEMLRYVPHHVVRWMIDHPPRSTDDDEKRHREAYLEKGYYPLPDSRELPVILPVRMSLSFPFLLSAVRLYAADYNRQDNWDTPVPILEDCWFADGGISSNFPVTLFDSPLPSRPTFAISLAGLPPDRKISETESENIYLPTRAQGGIQLQWFRFQSLPGFFAAVVNSMQNWSDAVHARMPGYRDRIVTVFLDKTEGGLNLNMPADVLERLEHRGEAAGEALIAQFARGPGWQNHRRVRARILTANLAAWLADYHKAYAASPEGSGFDQVYADYAAERGPYPLSKKNARAQSDFAQGINDLSGDADAYSKSNQSAPHPLGNLRPEPRLDD